MARLFPLRSEAPQGETQPRVVDLEDEDADAVFSALSSTTAREIYVTLNEQPRTPSDVAEAIDSSIQNVRYHLDNLEEAGLIEVVDTWYSSRGNEMNVYAATNGPLIVTSERSTAERLRAALSRYLGGIVVLAAASLFVQYGLEQFFGPGADIAGSDGGADHGGDAENGAGGANGEDAANGGDSVDNGLSEDSTVAEGNTTEGDAVSGDADASYDRGAPDSGSEDAATPDSGGDGMDATDGAVELAEAVFEVIPPGALFFLGGLFVLTVATAYWYRRAY